ncbi:MAG TPA: PPOX class F420-dependent oxidoreductase, partial [Anaerolineales bacterium]|nr:PPOX class F420-dependent oxidoreductase [Anaerolineales bacterium]
MPQFVRFPTFFAIHWYFIMTCTVPASHLDLLEQPIVVVLATVMPNGQPQVNCVWCLYDGTHLRLFTWRGTQKERNLRDRPQATVLAVDPHNPYRYLEIRGMVEEMTQQGAEELADQLTQRYVSQPTFFGHVEPNEKRSEMQLLACRIRPTRVVT